MDENLGEMRTGYLENRIRANAMGVPCRPVDPLQTDRLLISRKQPKPHRERIDTRVHSKGAANAAFSSGAERSTPRRIAD